MHGRIVEAGSGNEHPELSCAALAEKRQAATRELFQHFDEAKPFIGSSVLAALLRLFAIFICQCKQFGQADVAEFEAVF